MSALFFLKPRLVLISKRWSMDNKNRHHKLSATICNNAGNSKTSNKKSMANKVRQQSKIILFIVNSQLQMFY